MRQSEAKLKGTDSAAPTPPREGIGLVLIQRFLDWLYEDLENRGTQSASLNKTSKRALLGPATFRQITQRSLPSPERLSEIAAEYEARQRQIAKEDYQAFLNTGYPNFMQWVESLIEKSAAFGGRLLLLTFDNATGIVTATTPGRRQILPPTSYAVPIPQSAVQKLAAAAADHFQKADFLVHVSRQENTYSRLGAHLTPAYDCLDIFWTRTEGSWPTSEHLACQACVRAEWRSPFSES